MYPNKQTTKTLNFALKEIAFWYTFPSIFLFVYIGNFHFPIEVAYNHLYLITLLASTCLSLKIILFRVLKNKKEASIISSVIYGTLLLTLVAYYILVIAGLGSWGKVITSELFLSYITHAQQFCDSVDVSFELIIIAMLTSWLLTLATCHYLHTRHLTPVKLLPSPTPFLNTLLSILTIALFALITSKLLDRILSPNLFSQEPINLTLYSGKTYNDMRFFLHKLPHEKKQEAAEASITKKYKPNTNAIRKNVIIIIVDALSTRNMQLYGYKRNTTPFLSSLEAEGTLIPVKNFHTSCPETACAISSLLASRAPHQLPENAFTLSEVLKRHGYHTSLILGGDHTSFYSMRKFYGNVDEYYDGSMEKKYFFNDDEFVLEKTKQLPIWDGSPIFLQFHLMSAHTLGKHHDIYKEFTPSKSYAGLLMGDPNIEYTNHYDNGVLQADHYIKNVLDTLQKKQYLDNSIVIITADHGELLGEHGQISHANSVWEELLHAPLMLMQFSEKTTNSLAKKSFTHQIDIAPSILEELSIPIPASWQGKPIQDGSDSRHLAFFRWPPYTGLYDYKDHKNILKYWTNFNTGEEFIYNISVDPNEQNNLVWDPALQAKKRSWHQKIASEQSFELANVTLTH